MQAQTFGKLNIILAVYGLETVTEKIQNLVIDGKTQSLNFTVNNTTIGEDGWRGQIKSLTVVYNYDGGHLLVAGAKESEVLKINTDTIKKPNTLRENNIHTDKISVLAATYGPEDVTEIVQKLVTPNNTLSFIVDNETLGDTWNGIAKTLVIVLGYNDEVKDVEIFAERESCNIDLNESVSAF